MDVDKYSLGLKVSEITSFNDKILLLSTTEYL